MLRDTHCWAGLRQVPELSVPEGVPDLQGGCVGGTHLTHAPPPARTCEEPASNPPHVWPDDITKWPVRAQYHHQLGTPWWPAQGCTDSLGPDSDQGSFPSCF